MEEKECPKCNNIQQDDFREYICKNSISIISYKRFYMDDFDPNVMEEIKGKTS